MKRLFLLPVLLLCLTFVLQAGNDKGNDLQKKSELKEPYGFIPSSSSFPMPFTELSQSAAIPAISTGYYFYDTAQNPLDTNKIKDLWSPKVKTVPDTTYEQSLWKRILAGPRMVPKSTWENNPYGKYFFRNPADMIKVTDIYDPKSGVIDTIKNAIAGPMPIGIKGGFYFNGLRYDSFYVSTNGIIGLTNRRYTYDESGTRVVPSGSASCYDLFSMDWFCGGTRVRSGNGIDDESYDDFGYNNAILGRNPDAYYPTPSGDPFYTANAGLRNTGKPSYTTQTDLSQFTSYGWSTTNCKPALIAPFWGNISLSQFNSQLGAKEDYGKVYFKTSKNGDSLIIAYYNVTFRGTVNDIPSNKTMTFPENARASSMKGYCEWDAKVVLAKRDSSITFNYTRLSGKTLYDFTCGDLIRANTAAGVLGWARHINYSAKNPNQQVQPSAYSYPWSAEYMQYSHYFSNNNNINNKYPANGTTVKIKQWRNTLRAVNIVYRVRDTKQKGPDFNYDFLPDPIKAPDFEMLAGEALIGAIQPMGVVQNLTNDIQGPDGVNYVPQDLEFKALFIITNVITNRVVYSRDIPVSKKCLQLDANWTDCANDLVTRVRLVKSIATDASLGYKVVSKYTGAEVLSNGFTGIPPYKFVEVTYPAFEPNEFIDNQIGRMHCKMIARPVNLQGLPMGDKWPFDDTLSIRLFVIRRLTTFNDDVSEFNIESNTGFAIPSVLKWVSIDAYAVDGDVVSMHPLPPRGSFKRSIPGEDSTQVPANAQGLLSPVIHLNRTVKVYGQELEKEPTTTKYNSEFGDVVLGGDEIRSFPIDLREKFGAVLSFSLQRGKRLNPGYNQDYYRGWGDKNLQGPESKIYVNSSPFRAAVIAGNGGSADMICLEFAKPSTDKINGICNIPEADWRYLPQRRKSKVAAATNMPVLTMYGGGGYLEGFLKEDPDSVLKYPDNSKFYYNAINQVAFEAYFLFDEGLDWEYKKFAVQIPDTFIRAQKEGAKNFRFRFKVMAKDHNPGNNLVPDDYDDFFVDNVNILFKDTLADLECGSVRIDWPYTLIPASQATNIPVIVKVANNTVIASETFGVKVRIYRDGDFSKDSLKSFTKNGEKIKPLYCRVENIANLKPGTEIEVQMPAWNARKFQLDPLGKYVIVANIVQRGKDLLPNNDTTFFDAELRFGDAFAYDPVDNPKSDVGKEVPAYPARGLNLPGSSYEQGAGYAALTDENRIGTGIITNGWSGRMATRFVLANTDTIKGFQVYFTSFNASPDLVEFTIIRTTAAAPTEKVVVPTRMYGRRGDVGDGKRVFNKYITYVLDTPVELAADNYWVSITQMATDGMNLGASGARSAVKVSNWFQHPITGIWGTLGTSLYLDKNFRIKKENRYANQNFFAYVNSYPSESWAQFTPSNGCMAYAHTNHQGLSLIDNTTNTYINGTWIPMLRPFFGERSYGQNASEFEECPDDMTPVDMVGFKGINRQAGIELIWETATETNNSGFEVQRRNMGDDEWNQIGFVSGAGTSLTSKYYSYLDKKVNPSSTYQYQIRQIDNDGTVSCKATDIITVTYDNIGELTLNQNTPNPFSALTDISFSLPTNALAKLEIVDLLGNTVKVLNNSNLNAGKHSFRWDSKDEFGNDVNNGTYIYRLVVADQVRTAKMTLMK
ncbi:MAG: FlgD immunoglobulin-like domain containing protein [bacterium]